MWGKSKAFDRKRTRGVWRKRSCNLYRIAIAGWLWDKIVGEKCIAEKNVCLATLHSPCVASRVRHLSRNVDHVNNIPALYPRYVLDYAVIAVAFRRCSRDVTSRAASLPPLSVFHSITQNAELQESRVHAALYSAESREVLKGLSVARWLLRT